MDTESKCRAKNLMSIQVKMSDLQSLRQFSNRLKGQWHRAFEGKYGKILSLIEVEVQSAPTLEEYERLLGLPLTETPSYFYKGALLVVGVNSKASEGTRCGGPSSNISRGKTELLLEGGRLADFPRRDRGDMAAINAFLARRDRGENPTIGILANTYCTLNYCYERKWKSMVCCKHLFYLWLTTHVFHNKCKTAYPMEDFKWCLVKTMTNREWTQYLRWAT
ncbi:hypothetical protein CR513_26861, partial [Mucuna pruriens]